MLGLVPYWLTLSKTLFKLSSLQFIWQIHKSPTESYFSTTTFTSSRYSQRCEWGIRSYGMWYSIIDICISGSLASLWTSMCKHANVCLSYNYLCWSHLKVTMLTEVAAVGAPPYPKLALRTASRNFPSWLSTSSYVCPSIMNMSAISSVRSWQE